MGPSTGCLQVDWQHFIEVQFWNHNCLTVITAGWRSCRETEFQAPLGCFVGTKENRWGTGEFQEVKGQERKTGWGERREKMSRGGGKGWTSGESVNWATQVLRLPPLDLKPHETRYHCDNFWLFVSLFLSQGQAHDRQDTAMGNELPRKSAA